MTAEYGRLRFALPAGHLHGDFNIGNVLRDEAGRPKVIDLDGFVMGPREWDLMQTAMYYESFGWHTEAEYAEFVAGYGSDVREWSGYTVLRSIRELLMVTWLSQNAGTHPRAADEVECPNQRQAHRTARTALGEAVRRGYAAKNAAALHKPPRMEEGESEVEPYSVEEVQCLLLEANKRRNGARWMLALALGLRQGETLGLRWSDVDLDNEYLKLRRNRLRPRYKHGCPENLTVRPGEGGLLPGQGAGPAQDQEHQVSSGPARRAPAGSAAPCTRRDARARAQGGR